MKPEDLKRLAAYMGYKPFEALSTIYIQALIYSTDEGDYLEDVEYDPLNNAEQCLEIIERFKFHVNWMEKHNRWEVFKEDSVAYGKTIPEAVTAAAIAAIK